MALAETIAPFLWGAGGSKKTPEQVAREREIAAALMQGGMDYSPVDHWLQGAARASQGLVGGLKDTWANEAETAGREGFQSQWDSVFGGGQAAPVQTAAIDPVAEALMGTPQTASDATAAVGGAPADWLNYANQGATRSLPLNDQLVNALSFLPELGVTMEVFSGGQPEAGQGPRVGSERHDHGNAADVFFYKDGQKLDWANPQHQPLFQEIVRRGKAAGITGFGAGDGYMQPGSMHLGFGPEAVWGAGGKGENAPDWLRSAFSGSPSGSPVQVAQAGQPSIQELIGLSSDPWANESQQQILQALMGQQLQQQDPAYQLDLALKQAQLDAANAPAGPEYGFTFAPDGTLIRTDKTSGGFDPMGQFAAPGDPNKAPTVQKVTLADGSEMAVQWDAGTQAWVPINAPQGGGNLQPGDGLTEGEAKLTLFQTLQTETQPVLLDLEAQFNPANLQDAAARSTPVAGNFFTSEQGQIYNSASKAWAEGALRIATGAAATPEEMERTLGTYFAQPGDTPNTIAFKAQMREMYNRAINNSLGKSGEGSLPLPSDFAREVGDAPAVTPVTGPQSQPQVVTQQDYQSLPSGTPFIAADDPSRTVRIKP